MNELEAIVQRMIDAGESESNIAAVIQEYSKTEEAGKIQPQVTGAPVEETAAPDMVSNLEPPSLDLQEQKTAEQKKVVKGFLRTAAPFGANLLAETDFTRSLASFALRTTAGVVDAFERTILPAAEGATNPIRLAAYLSAEKEERDMMIKEAGTGVDMSSITELADFIDSAKPVYTDEEGNQLRATDLMQRGEFGRAVEVMAGELTSAAPSLAVSYLMPGIGSAILGVSTYGNEFENALKNRPEETAEKLYTASGLKGLSEWGFEYIGGKAFRALYGLKNANAPAESLKDYAGKYLNQVMLTFGANFAQEGLTEAATRIAQEYTDQLVYGDEKNLKEVSKQAFNDFLIGGLLGGPVAGVTRGIQLKQTKENKEEVYLYASPETKQKEILQARERAAKAAEDFNNAPEPLKTQYKEYKDEADKTKKDLENRLYERFDNLDRSELINYANNLKAGVAQQRIAQSSQDPEIKQKAREKARKAYEENEKLIGDLNFYDAKVEEAFGLRKARLEEQEKQLRKTTGLQKDDLKIKKLSAAEFEKVQTPEGLANKKASGMFLDTDGTIYLNKDVIPTVRDTNVLGHELLHYIMSRQFKVDDASMEPLITSFKDYLKENQPEALKRIEDRLEGAYKGNAPLEEYLNVFSDLVKNKGIASLKGIDKIKNEVNNTLQLLGFQSARLDTGEDVFNFIKNYTKNVNSDNMFIAKRALEVKLRSDVLKQTAEEFSRVAEPKFSLDTKLDLNWEIITDTENNINTALVPFKNRGAEYEIEIFKNKNFDYGPFENNYGIPQETIINDPKSLRLIFQEKIELEDGEIKEVWDITGKGKTGAVNPYEVFSIVANGTLDFIKKYDVNSITFTAKEATRIGLYKVMAKRFAKNLGWAVYQFDTAGSGTAFIVYNAEEIFKNTNITPKEIQEIKQTGVILSETPENVVRYSITPEQNENLKNIHTRGSGKILRSPIANDVIKRVAKAITKKYYDPIAADAKRNVDREEYELSAITELSLIATDWDPTKKGKTGDVQDFGKFLANRGFLRLSNLATRLGVESTEAFGGQGIMENVETSREVQEETEEQIIEITPVEKLEEKPTLSETLDLDVNIGDKSFKEQLTGILTKAVKLGVLQYNKEISENRTVTPFVASIKQYVAENLRVVTKQYINSYPGGYEAFLKDNKKVILLNFTTTYLSKHPLFKKGIEKSIGGTMGTDNTGKKVFEPNWTLPQEVIKNKFDWVDAKGNKAKIDRDNAGVRGLTSGPEIMRRNPKINSVISDNEFVDYHFQDGALRKKKKQNPEDALAMQLASEIGFEILKDDFKNVGPISAEFSEIAEIRGSIVGAMEAEQIAKDMDRGLVKYSISQVHAEEIVNKNLGNEIFQSYKNGTLIEDLQPLLNIPKERAEEYSNAFIDLLDKYIIPEALNRDISPVKLLNNNIFSSYSANDGVFLLSKEFIKFRDAKNKPSEEAKKFTKSFVNEALNAINNLETKEAKIEFIDNLIIYDAKTFTKAKTKYLTTNSELFNSIILPLIKAGKIADMYKPSANNGPIRKKYSDGKFRKINRPSEYDLSSTTLQLKIANDPVKFNSFALQAKNHFLNVWDFIKKSNNIELANAYLTLSLDSESSALRTAAWLKYSDKNAEQKQNSLNEKIAKEGRPKTKNDKALVWEHMTPASHVARAMISNFINENFVSNEELNNILNNYYVAIIDINLDKKIASSGLLKSMGKAYNEFGLTPEETRYKEAPGSDWKIDDYNEFNSAGVKVRYSLTEADINRMNAMISETGKVSVNEVSEVTATRLGATKGKFRFFIPPSADDFVGLMYYTLRKGKQGNEDLQFIKEKLLDPFTKGQAAFDSYKLNTLNQFRAFKKFIRKVPKAKLSAKNNLGFTNEEAVRIYIWDKKGVDIPGISKTEISSLVKLVNGNKDLLAFANNINTLLSAQGGYPDPQQNWFGGSITIDVLEHINEISRKEFFAEFREASNEMFGKLNNRGEISGPIANKLRAAYGDNYVEALSDVLYRMQNGRGREFGKNKLANQFNNWINNSVGAVMFLNARSALLQQVSLVNFINLSDNNPIKFAEAIANPKQYWADYLELINSDYLVQRRSGIKIDVNQDELAKAAESGRNPFQSVISLILKKGFVLTTWGDSNAIATGGAAFYRNRINTYLNDGLSETKAKEKAFNDFRELAEESQQSSRPDRISQQQASTLGRIILAWANTPMQYARITKKAALDLLNNRGDWKTNMSKLIYYGAVQNLMFSYLQAGLFSMIFDGEDDEEEDMKKYAFTFNSMADGFLRGLGFGGAIAATTKNMVLEAIDQSKGRGNYDEVVWEALKLSPPLASKISKARAVGRTFGWKQEREKVFTEGFSLDNPAFEAVGKAVSATTNIPLDRVVRKLDNISYPMRHDIEFWQAAALYLGWGQWELGLKDVEKRKKEKEKLKIKDKKYVL
jgi:hypothetical protein